MPASWFASRIASAISDRRGGRRLEALGEALDDVRRVTRLRRLRDRLDRAEAGRRVEVGDHEQAGGDADADQPAEPEARDRSVGEGAAGVEDAELERVRHEPVRDRVERRRAEQAGDDQALVEGALDVVGARADAERADDRGEDRDRAHDERVERNLARRVGREAEHAEQHHGDRGDRVGLEQVGSHAGAVADVVADVVGDHGRVPRVILGNARLDLADEVGADVGGLREDAAAESREDADQRATEAEADERVDRVTVALVGEQQDPVVAGDAEQRQADDEQAGDRAALEGDVERGADATAGRLGDARVRAHRHVHADEARRTGEDASDDETDRRVEVLDQPDRDRERHGYCRDDRVLTIEICPGALLDGSGDLLHSIVPR